MRVIEQWLLENAGDALPPEIGQALDRSAAMGENFLWLMDRRQPGTRAVVWGADGHTCVETPWSDGPNLGSILREHFGDRYYAVGLEFGGGSFLTRTVLPDGRPGDVRVVTLPPAPEAMLPWYLSRVSPGALLLDLRARVDDAAIAEWLHAPQQVYSAWWIPHDEIFHTAWPVAAMFDDIVFVDATTPIRLTENACKAVAARERF